MLLTTTWTRVTAATAAVFSYQFFVFVLTSSSYGIFCTFEPVSVACTAEVTDSAEISRQAKQANAVRQRILDDLRQQTLVIPRLTVDSLTQYDIKPTCSSHPLHVFLKQVFTERLSEPS